MPLVLVDDSFDCFIAAFQIMEPFSAKRLFSRLQPGFSGARVSDVPDGALLVSGRVCQPGDAIRAAATRERGTVGRSGQRVR